MQYPSTNHTKKKGCTLIADRLNGTWRGLLISCQRFQERKIDKVMRDFHEHKLLALPIAAGEVDLWPCHADSLRGVMLVIR